MTLARRVRVLVVDDSAFMRWVITRQLESDPDIQMVGMAQDGIEALEKIEALKPDVVTLDVEMPRMDGLEALARIRQRFSARVVMVSSLTAQGAEVTLKALRMGAVDFVLKPSQSTSLTVQEIREELIRKVKMAAQINPLAIMAVGEEKPPSVVASKPHLSSFSTRRHKLIIIGSSTGGPRALYQLIPQLSENLPAALIIVQHMPPAFTRSLADGLNRISPLSVREAQAGDLLATGLVLVAPGGSHLVVERGSRIRLDDRAPKLHGVRPSLDVTLESASRLHSSSLIAVVLTGMGSDGAQGCALVRANGGFVIAEDESTCVVYGMPRSVVEQGNADQVVPLPRIAPLLTELARSKTVFSSS